MQPTDNYLDSFQESVREEMPDAVPDPVLEIWGSYSRIIAEIQAPYPADMESVMKEVGNIMVNLARHAVVEGYRLSEATQDEYLIVGPDYEPIDRFVVAIGMLGLVTPKGAVADAVLGLAMFSNDHGFELEDAIERRGYMQHANSM